MSWLREMRLGGEVDDVLEARMTSESSDLWKTCAGGTS